MVQLLGELLLVVSEVAAMVIVSTLLPTAAATTMGRVGVTEPIDPPGPDCGSTATTAMALPFWLVREDVGVMSASTPHVVTSGVGYRMENVTDAPGMPYAVPESETNAVT
jgi:hypothetical protein